MDIYEYIAQDSKQYATRTVDRLTKTSENLIDFPEIGRKVPEYDFDDIREIFEGQYRLVYRIKKNQVDVLAVIHGARLLPDDIK